MSISSAVNHSRQPLRGPKKTCLELHFCQQHFQVVANVPYMNNVVLKSDTDNVARLPSKRPLCQPQLMFDIVAPVRQFSILGAAVRAPRAWCGLYTLVNRNNDVTSLYTCLSRKNYRNCSRVGRRDR